MTVIRCVGIFKTIEELILKILNTIPNDCHMAHISCLIVTEPFLGKIKPGMQEGKQIGHSSNLLKQKFLNLVNF